MTSTRFYHLSEMVFEAGENLLPAANTGGARTE